MIHSPPMHALTGPSRFGLVVVQVVFGEAKNRPDIDVVITGDLVRRSPDGALRQFSHLDHNRQPVLLPLTKPLKFAVNRKALRKLGRRVDETRTYHESGPCVSHVRGSVVLTEDLS